MNWRIGAVALAALVLAPGVMAGQNVQFGTQQGSWSACPFPPTAANCPAAATQVAVQPNSMYLLLGFPGDHDMFFYNAAGALVGFGFACGFDQGTVPGTAATGVVAMYGSFHIPQPFVCFFAPSQVLTPSAWAYVDGL
jgi:hypothetical protein